MGIPSRLRGGPCTLGKLSLLALGKSQLLEWKKKNQFARQKRATLDLDVNCDDQVLSWSFSKRVATSLLLPWVAAAKALGELSHPECLAGKQANSTSKALTELLEDEEVTSTQPCRTGLLLITYYCSMDMGARNSRDLAL